MRNEEKQKVKRTIKISELKCDTYSKKDNSPRGCKTVSRTDIKVGDYIVFDNHFTLVVADKYYYVSQEKWNNIPDDYKGIWHSYYGEHPEWLGRKTVMSTCITGNANENCGLLIEGVHFEIN